MMEYLKIATTILGAVGSAGVIILALASFLGRVWAKRILEADRAKYAREVEEFKRTIALSLKEYEIKTSTIQAERNQVILKLAPALSALYAKSLSFVEIGEMLFQFSQNVPRDLRTLGFALHEAAAQVQQQLLDATLYLDADTLDKAREFAKTLQQVRLSACEHFHVDLVTFEPTTANPVYPPESAATLLAQVKAAEPLLKELFEGFRHRIGTTR